MVEVEVTGKESITASGIIQAHANDQDQMEMVWIGTLVDYAEGCELTWVDCLDKQSYSIREGRLSPSLRVEYGS